MNFFPGWQGAAGFLKAAAVAAAPQAWNPLDMGANLSLSNANRTVLHTGAGTHSGLQAVTSHVTGKWGFEVLVQAIGGAQKNQSLGVGIGTYGNNSQLGTTANTAGYIGAGTVWANAADTGNTYSPWAVGDYINVLIDLDNTTKRVWWVVNGILQGTGSPLTPSGGVTLPNGITWFPSLSMNQVSDQFTINTGQAAFAYALPSGFLAWG